MKKLLCKIWDDKVFPVLTENILPVLMCLPIIGWVIKFLACVMIVGIEVMGFIYYKWDSRNV